MKNKEQKLISRGLDGDLEVAERKRLHELLATNPDAHRISRIWAGIGDRLRVEASGQPTPDSTVAWQDIHREIRQFEAAKVESSDVSVMGRFRWAGALAGLVVMGLFGLSAWQLLHRASVATPWASGSETRVEWVVAEIPGATTMIFTDEETDMTIIWMDVAQNNDPRDT